MRPGVLELSSNKGTEHGALEIRFSLEDLRADVRNALLRVAAGYDRVRVLDSRDRPLILFQSEWSLQRTVEKEKEALSFHAVAP